MPEHMPKWEEVEGRVRKAGAVQREAWKAAAVLKKTGRQRVAEIAEAREMSASQEVDELLGPTDSPERSLVNLQHKNLLVAVRKDSALTKKRQALLNEETEILAGMPEEPAGSELEAIGDIRNELDETDVSRESLFGSSPEAFYGLHLKELKEYKKDLKRGRMIETPSVKRQAEDVAVHLRAGKPVLVYGHLGAGKTELAMHVARNYLGKDALVISGSKYTSLAELYGHQVLAVDKIKKEEIKAFTREVSDEFEAWKKENPKATENEQNLAHDRILQTYLVHAKGGTISDFFLGPIYRAMEEGRPVILDEVNAIPHEVLISLNHILTRRVGETVNVQQDSGRKVKIHEGFGVMMTGNLNQGQEKYVDRQDMDPAFLSRLYKLEYGYLPQNMEGSLADAAGPENELFHLLLARMMDKNGNLEAPKDSLAKLWRLAQAARVIQDVFAGKEVSTAHYLQEAAGRPVKYLLKEAVLSPRALESVILQWQKEGYRLELDYYLWKEFVSQSTVASDRAYLYQELKDRFGFFKGKGWDQDPNYGKGGIVADFQVKPPENRSSTTDFFGPRDVIDAAYGKPPARALWPESAEEGAEEEVISPEMMDIEKFKDEFEKDLSAAETEVGDFCRV